MCASLLLLVPRKQSAFALYVGTRSLGAYVFAFRGKNMREAVQEREYFLGV